MQYYYIKDENNNNREDCIKYVDGLGIAWTVPNDPDNTDWKEYQAWLTVDENNLPQEEI